MIHKCIYLFHARTKWVLIYTKYNFIYYIKYIFIHKYNWTRGNNVENMHVCYVYLTLVKVDDSLILVRFKFVRAEGIRMHSQCNHLDVHYLLWSHLSWPLTGYTRDWYTRVPSMSRSSRGANYSDSYILSQIDYLTQYTMVTPDQRNLD